MSENDNDIHKVFLENNHVIVRTKSDLKLELEDRIFLCEWGFGCNPNNLGSKIFGYFLTNGEKGFIHRTSVVRLATEEEILKAKVKAENLGIKPEKITN